MNCRKTLTTAKKWDIIGLIDELLIHLNFHNERIFIMKTVAKVFIILGMIFQFYMIFPPHSRSYRAFQDEEGNV